MTVQLFDAKPETLNFYNAWKGLFDYLASERQKMFDGAYSAYSLADFLYGTVPASEAMPLSIWRKSFNAVISSLAVCGTYEQYILMLRGLFNVDAVITFTVQAAGDLLIDIDISQGQGLELFTFSTDQPDETIVTDALDDIVFARVLDTISSADLIAVLKATAPAGIKVTFTIS